MAKFVKSMLQADRTYYSPDGELYVDANRLKHWADTFQRMKAKGISVPSSFGHDDDPEKGVPSNPQKIKGGKKRRRLPQDTVGYLHDFRLTDNGSAAELTVELRRPDAVQAAESNTVEISPVIRKSWKDGDGQEWQDCWGHVDLVNQAVDHRQGPFKPAPNDSPPVLACALRMGLDDGQPTTYRLETGEKKMPEDYETKDGGGENNDGESAIENGDGRLKKVLDALAVMDIVLSDDTDEENFLEHLEQALLTKAAGEGMENGGGLENGGGEDIEVTAPQLAAMSTEQRKQQAHLNKQHQKNVQRDLDQLLADGRCTPAEHKDYVARLDTVRLSLDENGDNRPGRVETFIEDRRVLPKGTLWDDKTRTRMGAVEVTGHPSHVKDESAPPTPEEADAIADEILGVKK